MGLEFATDGIVGIVPELDCSEFRKMMASKGKKVILNTWMYNFHQYAVSLLNLWKTQEQVSTFFYYHQIVDLLLLEKRN